jgi:monofunctional glycosyltransferase
MDNTFRVVKRLLLVLMSLALLGLLGLAAWIWQPYDTLAWRVKLPIAGGVQVRVVPVLMLATSAPGRWLLDRRAFNLHHGDIQLYDDHGLRARCRNCSIEAKSVSDQPIVIPLVELGLQMQQKHIEGYLAIGEKPEAFTVDFTGKVSMRNLRLTWALPETPLPLLLKPLQAHSKVIEQAVVTGTLSAAGTLRWPRQEWSAQPQLHALAVSGLDISSATIEPVQYDCPLLDEHKHPEKMQWVPYEKMGRWLPVAAIIAEDAEFKHHPGYVIAQMQHLLGKESADKQVGGSTITQQLAKYMFTNGKRTWKRKVEELLYAVELESALTKTDILELYLNTVDLGPSLCGAHAASRYYFDLAPDKLNPIQAAWLAGIISNPHRAWKKQYIQQQPDLTRAENILRFMPRSARKQPGDLNFRPVKVAG